jgi:formylglycine-generating enzyme required for sulfatase activity/spore coat protein CotH
MTGGEAGGRPVRLPVIAAVAIGLSAAGVAIESADLFPRLRFAIQRQLTELPSTQAVPRDAIVRGLPLLSVYLQPDDLTELLENKLEHGAKWERQASVSYFDEGRLRFAAEAGVRVHGGGSRLTSRNQSFRLFFRRRYGTRAFAPRLLFGPTSDPLQRLVVHNDVRKDPADGEIWHLVNPLAYDLARRLGCITSETKPARFFLNGEDQGLYVLSEHFDDEYFDSHMPGRRISMDFEKMEALRDWVDALKPLTMETVTAQIDIDNLTSWFLAVLFAGTRDAYQGPGQFLDESRERGGWFWVAWDLDGSFREWDLDSFQYLLERLGERPRGRRANEPRAFVLTTLIAEDAAFRDYLAARIDTMLNHQLTPSYLEERRAHYSILAPRFGVAETGYLRRLAEFFDKRPSFLREVAEQWLNTAPGVPVSVRRLDHGALIVDGYSSPSEYRGIYFPGREVVIRLPDGRAQWYVNGRLVSQNAELRVRADRPLEIAAATASGAAVLPPEKPLAVRADDGPANPTPVRWQRIPAGEFVAGCATRDDSCQGNEWPRKAIAFPSGFELMDAEVTVDQYRAFAEASGRPLPRQPRWSGPGHPVVNVTWAESAAFCTSVGGRLPTEAEWEYAARGGRSEFAWPTGETFVRDAVNGVQIRGRDKWGATAPVRSLPAGAFGLFDMAGNVWEWTSDSYREAAAWESARDAADSDDAGLKTIRGGSWDSTPPNLRVTRRLGLSASGRHNLYVGFRCAR